MNCSVCGAMIPDGQSNCPNCGAMVQSMGQPVQPMGGYQQPVQPMGGYQQPVQPMGGYQQQNMGQPMGGYQQQNMGQPMGGYQQPNMGQPMGGYQQQNMNSPMGGANMGGFVNSLKGDIMKIVSLVGALFIMLTPFFTWFKFKMSFWGYTEKDSANMFGLAGGDYDKKSFAVFGIILLLIGLALILWEIAEFIPAVAQIKAKIASIPYIDLILIAVALVFIIIALANGDVNDAIKSAKEIGSGGHGMGPVIGFIGVIAAAAPRVLKMANINIGRR